METAIIIGAGPAGLTAAHELLSRNTGGSDDILPILLEATGEFGGLSRTHIHNSKRMDIGGHRFISNSAEIVKLWLSICPPQGAPAWDDRVLNRCPELAPGGPDPETAERVMLRRGAHSEEFYYPKLGSGQLWEAMAVDIMLMGGDIRMDSRVTGLRSEGGRVTAVRVETPTEGYELTGDWFFSSMPVKELINAMPADQTPEPVREIAAALPYRDLITVGLLVDSPALTRETKTSGDFTPDGFIGRDVKLDSLRIFNNWSPYLTGGAEGVWIGLEYICAEGGELWEMDDRAFVEMAAGELIKVGVLTAETAMRDSVRLRVPKAYPAHIGAYESFATVRAYLDSFENLFTIGRNGQHREYNMDHAMLTALTAARMAREDNTDRTAIWTGGIGT